MQRQNGHSALYAGFGEGFQQCAKFSIDGAGQSEFDIAADMAFQDLFGGVEKGWMTKQGSQVASTQFASEYFSGGEIGTDNPPLPVQQEQWARQTFKQGFMKMEQGGQFAVPRLPFTPQLAERGQHVGGKLCFQGRRPSVVAATQLARESGDFGKVNPIGIEQKRGQ